MINKIISVFRDNKERKIKAAELNELMSLIDETKRHLNAVNKGFNEATDEDLTEYFIYEKRAAEMRYKYLLRLCSRSLYTPQPMRLPALFRSIF